MCITEFNKQKFLDDCKREAEEERERADRAEKKAREAEEKARKEKFQSELSFIKILMGNTNMSAEEAMKAIGIKPDDFQKYADILPNAN